MMSYLILVRHGETDKNVNKEIHDFGDTESLNNVGKKQIKKTAQKLKEFGVYRIYCSRETRALESAKIISDVLKVTYEPIDGMEERNWGVFTGKPWEEVKKVLDPLKIEERYEYLPQDGESWRSFETRLINTLHKLLENVRDKPVVIVTHGGVIRALMPYLLNTPKEESFKYNPQNASLSVFEIKDGKYNPILIDDTSHLN